MPTSRTSPKQVAATYATCLLDAAQKTNRVFEDLEDLKDARMTILKSSTMRQFLQDPTTPVANKKALVKDAFSGLAFEVRSVLSVMVERADIKLLGQVAAAYEAAAEEALGVVNVDITTAVALDDRLRDVIVNKLSADLGRGVHLNEKVDASILGGIVMSAHGKRMDASVKTQLAQMSQTLKTASTGGEK